jgi:hypothetical protein
MSTILDACTGHATRLEPQVALAEASINYQFAMNGPASGHANVMDQKGSQPAHGSLA